MHYYTKLRNKMQGIPDEDIPRYSQVFPDWNFERSFPDITDIYNGIVQLSDQKWQGIKARFSNVQTKADYLKHMLALHDGEMRFVVDPGWTPFQASGGDEYKARYWEYQYARTARVRKFLFHRSQEAWTKDNLTKRELYWCMSE